MTKYLGEAGIHEFEKCFFGIMNKAGKRMLDGWMDGEKDGQLDGWSLDT